MSKMDELIALALTLPESDRAELAYMILLSLPSKSDANPDSEAPLAEAIEKRIQAFERGKSEAIPWREAMEKIRQTLIRERSA